ncbi:uncharacterized protein LAJ45_03779 [Morchella importuna]|uniref:uncharacterized protein n=1 Tax=Morchella importuna TaxID=1174673 RepID=UPI001E8EB4AB|nr:uncharacterized protein LAJ45_03779 [Morchella importuna]KAH8152352.1 hypothetical protein LAJ45_03779 [Morchella importuna]
MEPPLHAPPRLLRPRHSSNKGQARHQSQAHSLQLRHPGGEGARNHVQVFANSIVASILILLHTAQLYDLNLNTITTRTTPSSPLFSPAHGACFDNTPENLLAIGIIANYAATLSDTLSSELGILASSPPRLITTWNVTPKGTNGGITLAGITAGAAGAAIIGLVAAVMLPACEGSEAAWGLWEKVWLVAFVTVVGTVGSLLDSLLGALFQQSVIDVRSKKIVEAPNGAKVLVEPATHITAQGRLHSAVGGAPQSAAGAVPVHGAEGVRKRGGGGGGAEEEEAVVEVGERPNSRRVITAQRWGVLSNNQVNLVMAAVMSVVAMVLWGGLGTVGVVLAEQAKTVVRTVVKQEIIGAVVGALLAPILG